jgi:hypothetical protein
MHTIFWLEKVSGREFGRHKSRWEDNIRITLRGIRARDSAVGVATRLRAGRSGF